MDIGTALQQGSHMLDRGGIDVSRLTAEVLLCHALHCERGWLYAHSRDQLPERAWIHYGRYLDERLKGKPTQYITGIQEFYGRIFRVGPDVLIPRPETEHLVEAALIRMKQHRFTQVLDVGTGSGAIAITLALESGAPTFASDVSEPALRIAKRNSVSLQSQVHFFAADLLSSVRPQSIDIVVSNPPYISDKDHPTLQGEVRDWEPHRALFAGPKGMEAYERLFSDAVRVLRPQGQLLLELGYDSLEGVRECLGSKWHEVEVIHDLAGWPRVFVAAMS